MKSEKLESIESFLESYPKTLNLTKWLVAGLVIGIAALYFGDFLPHQYQKPQAYCYTSQNNTHATFQVSNSGSYPFLTDEFIVSGIQERDLEELATLENTTICEETTFAIEFPERPFKENITLTPKEDHCADIGGEGVEVGITDTIGVEVNPRVVEGETRRIVKKWSEVPYQDISGAAVIIKGLKDKETRKTIACERR